MQSTTLTSIVLGALVLSGCQARHLPVSPSSSPPPLPPSQTRTEMLPVYECVQTQLAVKVDGVLEAEAWGGIIDTGPFVQWNGKSSVHDTRAKLMWDDRFLYLAFSCQDPVIQPSKMHTRDQNLWEENEVVEFFVDANGDGRSYLEFEINPSGTVLDLLIPEADMPGPLFGRTCWDAKGMRCAVMEIPTTTDLRGADLGWEVEIAIPLGCFLDAPRIPPKLGEEWRINLYRVDTDGRQVEYQAWAPTNTAEPNFHVPERFGILRFVEGRTLPKQLAPPS
ncbi:MAG: carbohydrate-binding family 9-like protein [Candidatus Zipacnadales bacterium]